MASESVYERLLQRVLPGRAIREPAYDGMVVEVGD